MSTGLAEGTIFAGRYRVVRPIAAGGMGAVYEVVHLETERRRALKVMHPHTLGSAELRERFQREAKVAAHVESEFIVDVFDAGVDAATEMPFLVMELLRGEELGKRLKRLGRFSPAEVVTYLHQTALALDRTHKAQIVHRDLKPENLFLTEREDGPPRVKVLDFGIAKVVAESATAGGPTQSIGTPLYMAPEQFNPSARLTGAADRYALGMMAYTLLVGSAYWGEEARGGNVLALAMVAAQGPREPASARAARRGVTLPPGFDAWFTRAAAVDPALRFGAAVEMVDALAQALDVPSLPGGLATRPDGDAGSLTRLAVSMELPTLPLSVHMLTPPAAATPSSGAVPVATPSGASRRGRGAAYGVAALVVLAGAAMGLLRLTGGRGGAMAEKPAAAPTATATATVATASVEPVVVPSATAEAVASASASATATAARPSASPAATAGAKAAVTATAPAGKGPSDAERKKMWGRD